MKKQQKQIQYVDQFRKISTLQKLPNMNDRMRDFFEEDVEKENNNFRRMRKQPIIDKYDNVEYQKLILDNKCVQDKVKDRLNQEKSYYEQDDKRVREHINMFKNWSDTNKATEKKKQKYKFYYRQASPPKGISLAPVYNDTNFDKLNKKLKSQINEDKEENDELLFNFNNQDKYDFRLINEKRIEQFMQKPDQIKNNEADKDEDLLLRAFSKFSKYKTINAISKIEEWKLTEEQFFYDLNQNQKQSENVKLDDYFMDKFIYKSVTKSLKNTEKDIEYFRDIGLPSRNLEKYTQVLPSLQMNKQKEVLEEQTKQQAHFLHLLRQSQLNINKLDINFDDLSNISNGRVTSMNAYMCIRSEKITKAQFEKLLKRLDRYKKQEMKKGKQRQQGGGGCTENFEPETTNGNQKINIRQQKDQINQLVLQIGEIRQSTSFVNTNKNKKVHKNNLIQIQPNVFRKQQFTRLQFLLKKLYQKIVVDPHKYPFTFLENYIDKVDQILHKEYKNGKLLWFIMDCYEQILNNYPEQDSIKTVLKKKPIQQPKVSHFKGQKLLKQEQLKSTHLFTYRQKDKDKGTNKSPLIPTRDRDKTPKAKNSITSTKRGTQTKKPNYMNDFSTKRKLG